MDTARQSPLTTRWTRRFLAFVAACLLASAWGSLVQTQFNLGALIALGVDIPPGVRLHTSLQDLTGFGPVYAGIVAAAWLPAFAVAAWLVRRWPVSRVGLHAVAAGVGLAVAVRVVDAVAPMPVFIDATRGVAGFLALALGSAVGGALFAHWTRKPATTAAPGSSRPGDRAPP